MRSTGPWNGLLAIRGFSLIYAIVRRKPSRSFWAMPGSAFKAPDRAYQLIVLDAFSSDALPVHLLSREAIRLYRAKLARGGLLLFNLTNRYLDLDPVIGRQASDAGLVYRVCHDTAVSDDEKRAGKQASIWAVLAAERDRFGQPGVRSSMAGASAAAGIHRVDR